MIVKEPKTVLNLEKYEEPLPKKNPLDFILKDSVVEIPPSKEFCEGNNRLIVNRMEKRI